MCTAPDVCRWRHCSIKQTIQSAIIYLRIPWHITHMNDGCWQFEGWMLACRVVVYMLGWMQRRCRAFYR